MDNKLEMMLLNVVQEEWTCTYSLTFCGQHELLLMCVEAIGLGKKCMTLILTHWCSKFKKFKMCKTNMQSCRQRKWILL